MKKAFFILIAMALLAALLPACAVYAPHLPGGAAQTAQPGGEVPAETDNPMKSIKSLIETWAQDHLGRRVHVVEYSPKQADDELNVKAKLAHMWYNSHGDTVATFWRYTFKVDESDGQYKLLSYSEEETWEEAEERREPETDCDGKTRKQLELWKEEELGIDVYLTSYSEEQMDGALAAKAGFDLRWEDEDGQLMITNWRYSFVFKIRSGWCTLTDYALISTWDVVRGQETHPPGEGCKANMENMIGAYFNEHVDTGGDMRYETENTFTSGDYMIAETKVVYSDPDEGYTIARYDTYYFVEENGGCAIDRVDQSQPWIVDGPTPLLQREDCGEPYIFVPLIHDHYAQEFGAGQAWWWEAMRVSRSGEFCVVETLVHFAKPSGSGEEMMVRTDSFLLNGEEDACRLDRVEMGAELPE